MSLVFGHSVEVAEWVGSRIPYVGANNFGACEGIGIESCGRIIAGVIYHDYQPQNGTIQVSIAADSPMWARRETIKALLHYPFEQLQCYKVWSSISHKNEMSIKVCKHIGFKQEAVLRHQFGIKNHGVVCGLIKPEYVKLYQDRI